MRNFQCLLFVLKQSYLLSFNLCDCTYNTIFKIEIILLLDVCDNVSHLTFKGLFSNFSKKYSFHNVQLAWALLNLSLHEVDSGGFSFVRFRLRNYLITYYLLYSSKFLKISIKRSKVFYIKYIIYLRVFSTGKSLRINYYTAQKAKSVDCKVCNMFI